MRRMLLVVIVMCLMVVGSAQAAPPVNGVVASSGIAMGIAPGAPASVRQHVAEVRMGVLGRINSARDTLASDFNPSATANAGVTDVSSNALRRPASSHRAKGAGCWNAYAWRELKNFIGFQLFITYQQLSWCGNGYVLTGFYRDRFPGNTDFGWRYLSHYSTNCTFEHCQGRGSGTWSTNAFTQEVFANCGVGYCISYKYPWINMWVNASGGVGADTGGT